MKYIFNTANDPAYNLAFEQSVFENESGDILIVWIDSPSVIVGRNQNIFDEVDILKAKKDGVCVIRRDTGGGTVYHDTGNVNYAIITDNHDISVDYDTFLDVAVAALNSLCIKSHKNKICDIAIDGMKISGSAQRQTKTRVLHHGTLLFDTDLCKLSEYCKKRDAGYTSKAIESNRSTVTNINSHFKIFENAVQFANAFAKSITQEIFTPSDTTVLNAKRLAAEKYTAWEWNFGKNPAFSCDREYCGRKLHFASKKGVITEFECTGTDAGQFIGKRLCTEDILQLCKENNCMFLYELLF